jgi:exocyst complex component 6
MAAKPSRETSPYMQELTRYLQNIMSSVLLGLPTEIKELIYFDALSHAATMILSLPLDDAVKRITPAAVATLSIDVAFLSDFVDSLNNPILKENLDELCQTVALMGTDNTDEFYDVSLRNKKYGRVDRENGMVLVMKVMEGAEVARQQQQSPVKSSASEKFATMSSRLGFNK